MDGNAQNMFHGNHQGDAYYRYDAAAAAATPRAMGPPGGYPRHRPPHPLQQQPQYPSYQPATENLYAMGADQHAGMGMGDLGGWGSGPTPGQAAGYPGPGLGAYGHPQTTPSPQRQAQSQPGYRQHISAYPQQDQQKLSFSTQQSMMGGMMQQPGYVGLNQQQSQQQRIPQHYPQAASHPMYPGAPQAQTAAQPYGPYGTSSMQHQPGRPPQHVAYSHTSLDQASYGQHVPSSTAPGHHLGSQQQPPQLGHPPQTQQSHIGQPSQNHMPVPGQTQPQPLHPSQVVHPSQPTHPSTNQSTLPGLPPNLQSGPTVSQQQSQPQSSAPQAQNIMSTQHLHAPGPGPQNHAGLLHPNPSVVTSQHQSATGSHSIPHSIVSGYSVQHQSQQQQQSPYMSTAKPQPTTQLSSSPQYRAPFPQLSPQMSPRPPQMSPHPQMSPRPVMSPAKPQTQTNQLQSNPSNTPSPHHPSGLSGMASPRPHQQQPQSIQPASKTSSNVPSGPVNTLQALEQMVMPSQNSISGPNTGLEYPQYRQQPIPASNAMSPMGPRMPMSPQHHQQWTPLMNMQPPTNSSLSNLTTQPSQQHLYAQSLSHQVPQVAPPQPQPPPPNQQMTPPQLSEQLQHSINDITGHQVQPVPVSQALPPTSTPNQQTPPHQQHLTPLQTSNTLQPISHDSNSPISDPHLMSPVKSSNSTPLQEQQSQQQQSTNLIDSFLTVMESTSPQLKTLESNSNDSSNLVNNDTSSNNSIVNNQSSSVSAHDSNSNPLNQNLFTVPVDTNSSHLDYENSNHAPTPLQCSAALEGGDNANEEAPKDSYQDDLENSENSQDLTELHQMQPSHLQSPTSTDNNLNQQNDMQVNDNFSLEKTSEETRDVRDIGDVNPQSHLPPVCHPQQTDIQPLPQKSPEVPGVQNIAPPSTAPPSTQSAQVATTPQSQPQMQQQAPTQQPQAQPPIQAVPPLQTPSAILGPATNQLLSQTPTMHSIPPIPPLHTLPGMTQLSTPTPVYDPQQQLLLGPVHPGIQATGMPGIPPTGHHIPSTIIPPHGIAAYPPGPISHHQERAALQQQLQELYCMPHSTEQQEKIIRLQERLNMLQQHENNDQCNGGAQCILQSPLYSSTQMIESPQVSSTTGRGRSKGSSKPRKPRQKKSDKSTIEANTESSEGNITLTSALPVSEDCVTQGAGDASVVAMMEFNEIGELSQDNSSSELLDTSTEGKKPKKPRKPRTPKDPNKSPKEKVPKEKKEKKSKEPKDPNDPDKPKKKRGRKSDIKAEGLLISGDGITPVPGIIKPDGMDENVVIPAVLNSDMAGIPTDAGEESKIVSPGEPRSSLNDDNPDFDDIPVSKIPIKLSDTPSEESEVKKEENENETSQEGSTETPIVEPSSSKKKKKSSSSSKKRPMFGKPNKKRKNRGRIVPESDGEGDDMVATPPPSPPPDSELDSSKRRSARNTQRKKYIDDVMLRFSDDESTLISSSPVKKEKKPPTSGTSSDVEKTENNAANDAEKTSVETIDEPVDKEKMEEGGGSKPNYVYVNTGDEDSMVVQYVLAVRIGKRELKPEPIPAEIKETPEVEVKPEENEKEKVEQEESKIEDTETSTVEEENTVEKEKPEKSTESPKPESVEDEKLEEQEEIEDEKEETVIEKEESKMDVDEEPIDNESEKKEVEEEENEEKEESEPNDANSTPVKEKEETAEIVESRPPVFVEVEEYLVKYRNFSYLHCEWRTEEELFKGDRRIASKIKRFQMKQTQQMNIFDSIEEEPFNPDFVEVDRVLDVSEHMDSTTGEKSKHYLVKWKSLPYEDCTWELEEDVDEVKIEQFYKFNKLPPKSEWKPKKRPSAEQWKKLDETPIYKNNNTLRPYQLEGLNWLKFSWYNGHNCILADEMGLGKTIQSLTFVHSVWEYGIRGPFLVIAPLSTIPNWQREFESWTDMNVIVYHGSLTSKQMLSEYECYYKSESGKTIKDFIKFNVLITTFEMIVTDYQDLRSFNWRVCVIDEAHRLKNRNCKLLEGLRQLNLEHRVLLSGTPLQNNVNELFSLLNFLEPTQFSCAETFLNEFGSLKTESEVQKLQALLKPMMLRRLKDDVEKSLAPKEETIVEVELTNIQKKYYRGILEQNFSFLKKGTTSANIPNLMNTMMELRKCCIHPYLLNGAEDQIQYDYRLSNGEDQDSYYKNLINSAGKMVLIDKLLPKLKANGHRVLIFSQMVRCLDILEDYLMYKKYPFERIDGRIRGNLRQAAIDRFSRPDSDRFVFLLCTKAGGLGINLTAADTVIIYDSDWNPQNDLQAQARCHRIGQQKMVKIYRLLCRNTYEREMFDKASLKLGLDKAILQSMNTSQGKDSSNRQLSKKEIEDLLKKGAYGAVMDDDNAGDKFCEEDIDSILKRRTQVITMEYEKGSTFSKASFAASGNRSDIKIDDPDFWNKWAKKAEIDPNACERDETEDLVISEPRRRTQIKRYGHDDGVMDMSEDSSVENSDEDSIGLRSRRRKEKLARRKGNDDYIPRDRDTLAALGLDEIQYGSWAKSECFKVEKGLLSFGWGRWPEIQEIGQFKRGWRESDIEDCARIILLYCLHVYKGDEKIKNFIWDLITPTEDGEVQKISRDHSGLHNLVPRGRNAKGRNGGKSGQKDALSKLQQDQSKMAGGQNIMDPNHWSKEEKYDAEAFLEGPYKKHLGRHANKVLLRVRMLYYIQHEVIGDLVQQIHEGVNASELPIRPPTTPDQMPSSWWNPNCCDKSLLVGTYKHGCEMYRQIRADPTLCFSNHIGPGDDAPVVNANNDDDVNSKHEDADDVDDDGTATKDSDSKITDPKDTDLDRPSSSGLEEEESANSYPPTNMPSDDTTWPSMQDLNTRLRRVITSYQRNYKKEELKQQQKAKLQALVSTPSVSTPSSSIGGVQVIPGSVATSSSSAVQSMTSCGAGIIGTGVVSTSSANNCGQLATSSSQSQASQMPSAADIGLMLSLLNPVDASQLANLDLNKLAMYLKMERQGKMEQAAKERERVRLESIPKKWNRREEYEFLRVLTGYGIDLQQSNIIAPDWTKFKTMSRLERKSDETLSDYYKVFIAMCKRQAGVKLTEGEKGLEGIIDDIGEDHAKLVLDRLELLSKLREISRHPLLDERLKLCQNNFDTPDWWESGKHDKELLIAVLKHGLYRSECFIFNDPTFSFLESERRFARELEAQIQRSIKVEPVAAPVPLPPEIEEVTVTKEEVKEEVTAEKQTDNEVVTEDKKESTEKPSEETAEVKAEPKEVEEVEKPKEEENKKPELETTEKEPEKPTEETAEKTEIKEPAKEEAIDMKKETEDEALKKEPELLDLVSSGDPDDDEVMKEKEKAVEEECKKQAAELKARFPDLEVIQPQVKLKIEKERPKIENIMVVRWFRDFALEKRISHIVTCVEKNQWPVGKNYSAYTGCQGMDLDIPLYETVTHTTNILDRRSNTPDVITITTDQGVPKHLQAQLSAPSAPVMNPMGASNNSKKRKRHIAIDVETERAKLHALLNSTQISLSGQKSVWDDDNDSRRSSQALPLQPPPAHQHQPLTRQTSTPFSKPSMKNNPTTSMAPIDLSSSLPKVSMCDMMKSPIDLSEVQDFSMSSKKTVPSISVGYGSVPGKGKLDDTLTKLMKKNNCTIEEPIVGKEKKRKKLDEIVLGLSAAKEQKTFPDPSLPSSKKPPITPSVSVTPANIPSSTSNQSNQKPFTITVTSVPGNPKSGPSSSQSSGTPTGLAALQNMAMGGSSASSSKDSLNALLAQTMQTDPQTFLKQQQKMMQQLPASQRKAYEGMLAEMKQAMELSQYLSSSKYSSHDAKVNKWLAEQQNAALNEQLNMDYRRSTRQQHSSNVSVPTSMSQSSSQPPMGPKNLTGEEQVPVIHKQTGKRLTGNKAPQLKRLMQWLNENPAYEVDPKWLEHMQNPMAAPSPKPQMDTSNLGSSSSNKGHGRSSSGSSGGSGMGGQQQSSKKGRPSAIDQANAMQFASLAGLNPNLLSGLPGLGAFDPKNPLLMPFAGMPGLGGMGGLGNLNNMNLFANLAGLGGLGNLAGMDAQSLAALMAAANTAGLSNLGGTGKPSNSQGNKKGKSNNDSNQQNSSQSGQGGKMQSSSSSSSAGANNAAFPFLFPNPSLLYPPLGLGGLNPYSLSSGMSAYDQLAQQYNLLNGAGVSGTSTSTSNTGSRQSQSKSTSSRTSALSSSNMGGNQQSSSSGRGRGSNSSRAAENSQLSSLLMPTADPHLLESLSRMAGMDIAQASRLMSGQPPVDKRSSMSKESQEKQAAKESQKWMESLARGALPPDLAAIQAFTQGKMPSSSSSKSSSKNSQMQLPLPTDISQAFLAEMAAQAMAAAASTSSSASNKRSRDQEMKDAFEQFSKQQMDLYTRTLGLGSGISLIPTSAAPVSDDHKSKRVRSDSHTSTSSKDDISAIPLNLGEKGLRGGDASSLDKVTLTPVAAASIAASLPSQTTITIAPPISSGASTSSGCSEGRSGLTISSTDTPISNSGTNKQIPSDSEVEDLVIQKQSKPPTPVDISLMQHHQQSPERQHQSQSQRPPSTPPVIDIQPVMCDRADDDDHQQQRGEERRSGRLKRPRSGLDSSDICPPPEKRRELRSAMRTRQSGNPETLNLSTSGEDKSDTQKD